MVKGGEEEAMYQCEMPQSQRVAMLLCDVTHLFSSCDMLQTRTNRSSKRSGIANRFLKWQLRLPKSKDQTLPGLLKASAKTGTTTLLPHFTG